MMPTGITPLAVNKGIEPLLQDSKSCVLTDYTNSLYLTDTMLPQLQKKIPLKR